MWPSHSVMVSFHNQINTVQIVCKASLYEVMSRFCCLVGKSMGYCLNYWENPSTVGGSIP